MQIIIIAAVFLAIAAGIYGLHRLGVLDYSGSKSGGGGGGYNPLQEMIEPQARHVVQVEEQRVRDDDEGGPGMDGDR
jgi:hypothetical protein